MNPQKCELIQISINYLGHTINSKGTKLLSERIEKILTIPQPSTLKQANAFIGAIEWYRKFIKNYAKIEALILAVTNLSKQNKHKFKWDTAQCDEFDKLKNISITEPLFLNCPDPNVPLVLSTDASNYCIDDVLYQEINGERKNIYFHSQMLPKLQRKWATVEEEPLAVYYCVTRMKLDLLGRELIIRIDHRPLRNIYRKISNNRRVARISPILQQYNIKETRHLSDKCNCLANYLNRYSCPSEDDDEFLDQNFGDIPGIQPPVCDSISTDHQQTAKQVLGAIVTQAQAKIHDQLKPSATPGKSAKENSSIDHQSLSQDGHGFDELVIKEAQQSDKFYQTKVVEIQVNPNKNTYALENGILHIISNYGTYKRKLLYIPPTMVKQLLAAYHNAPWAGHFDVSRTYFKLKDKYWWPNMKTTIKNYIQSCLKCQMFNIDRHKTPGLLHPIKPPDGPFQLTGIDYTGPFPVTPQGNKYVLTITDYFTKWVIAVPLSNQTARAIAEALYERYICIYGVPIESFLINVLISTMN